LISAGIALIVQAISAPVFPLIESSGKNLLKLYLNDVGILSGILYGTNIRAILDDERRINLGSVYESVEASELIAKALSFFTMTTVPKVRIQGIEIADHFASRGFYLVSNIGFAFVVDTIQQKHFINSNLNNQTAAVVGQLCQTFIPVNQLIDQCLMLSRILDKSSLTIDRQGHDLQPCFRQIRPGIDQQADIRISCDIFMLNASAQSKHKYVHVNIVTYIYIMHQRAVR
jgi:hypothetical protein